MMTLLSFTTLVTATLLALAAGTAFQWLLLRVTLQVLPPATAARRPVPTPLAPHTPALARAWAPDR
jgi:hypothetical protein